MATLFHPRKCVQFTVAQIADVDALVTAKATVVAIQTYTGAGLDGTLGGTMRLPQHVTLTTSAVGAQYVVGSTAVITGTHEGQTVTETFTLTAVGGGEFFTTTQAFDAVTSIVLGAQAGVGGQVEFGVADVVASRARPGVQIEHGSGGDIEFTDDDGVTDTVTGATGNKREIIWMSIGAGNTTSDPVILYTGTDRG